MTKFINALFSLLRRFLLKQSCETHRVCIRRFAYLCGCARTNFGGKANKFMSILYIYDHLAKIGFVNVESMSCLCWLFLHPLSERYFGDNKFPRMCEVTSIHIAKIHQCFFC
jgi:hypothetical protein